MKVRFFNGKNKIEAPTWVNVKDLVEYKDLKPPKNKKKGQFQRSLQAAKAHTEVHAEEKADQLGTSGTSKKRKAHTEVHAKEKADEAHTEVHAEEEADQPGTRGTSKKRKAHTEVHAKEKADQPGTSGTSKKRKAHTEVHSEEEADQPGTRGTYKKRKTHTEVHAEEEAYLFFQKQGLTSLCRTCITNASLGIWNFVFRHMYANCGFDLWRASCKLWRNPGCPAKTIGYNPKSLAAFLHSQAGIQTQAVVRDSVQSVVAPWTTRDLISRYVNYVNYVTKIELKIKVCFVCGFRRSSFLIIIHPLIWINFSFTAVCNITTCLVASELTKTAMVQAEQDPDLPRSRSNVLGKVVSPLFKSARASIDGWWGKSTLGNNVWQPILRKK